jgi:hypothetical protein
MRSGIDLRVADSWSKGWMLSRTARTATARDTNAPHCPVASGALLDVWRWQKSIPGLAVTPATENPTRPPGTTAARRLPPHP